jgi:ubiquinone/menaquinone biosynthesis C-methylase UbiE
MIEPTVWSGVFTPSTTARVSGLQYHLGGAQDTAELANLAGITAQDHVLDVCCYLGGPAVQLASTSQCHVTGIDCNPDVITAARRIAHLAALEHQLEFYVGDARRMPFPDAGITVVWCQCSVAHDDAWFAEFDRILQPGGRLALTLETRPSPHPWSLPKIVDRIAAYGYTIRHVDDITARDIELGWKSLDAKLTAREAEYRTALGDTWVAEAHRQFSDEIRQMQAGEWGNGRVVAQKR